MMEVHTPSWDPTVEFSSDASGSWGCGAVWGNQWIQPPWQEAWQSVGITAKELLPIVIACALWGQYWAHCQVQVWCDNSAVVYLIVNIIMHLLQCLHFFCAHFDILLQARHIQGKQNIQADALTCSLLQVFYKELPCNSQGENPDPPIPVGTTGDSKARLALSFLEGVAQQLIERSVAPITARNYLSAQKSYIDLCG